MSATSNAYSSRSWPDWSSRTDRFSNSRTETRIMNVGLSRLSFRTGRAQVPAPSCLRRPKERRLLIRVRQLRRDFFEDSLNVGARRRNHGDADQRDERDEKRVF